MYKRQEMQGTSLTGAEKKLLVQILQRAANKNSEMQPAVDELKKLWKEKMCIRDRAREGRKADELKRSIRNNAAQLNQMVLRPKPGKYVQQSLIVQAAEVAKLADMAVLNETAVKSLTRLENAISKTMGTKENPSSIAYDWEKTGVPNMIAALRTSLMDSKDEKIARLKQQLEETAALPDSDKSEQLRDRLRQPIRETENRTYLPMTVDQMRMLKAITLSLIHI